ncbi:MAG: DUF3105 domain-containing protein [Chloroflexota bacterium]
MVQSTGDAKRDRREAARHERRTRVSSARQRERTRRRMLIGAFVTAALVIFLGLLWLVLSSRDSVGRSVPLEGSNHVEEGSPLAYQSQPPTSGPHYPMTAPYGVSDQPISPGYWVHSLEHGGIGVLYNCAQPCPELVAELRDAFVKLPRSRPFNRVKLVATPYPQMPSRVAFVAWGKIEEHDSFDYERLLRFYNAYLDKGPEQAL